MGNLWEISRKFMGNLWEIYGKFMGNLWDIYGHLGPNDCLFGKLENGQPFP